MALKPMQKVDDEKEMVHPIVKKMLEEGIPVYRADFHSAVNNSDDVPETNFSDSSNAQSRRVKMWWINCDGLLCLHKNKYFFVPEATVKFAKFY